MTTRPGEIKQWLAKIFPNVDLSQLKYIQGDAGDRKYLRLSLSEASFIIMDTKPSVALDNFLRVAQILEQHQINVPKIIATDIECGMVLMTDFGADTYLKVLQTGNTETINNLYHDALKALIKIQSIGQGNNIYALPPMDYDYIKNRLDVFRAWYLQTHLKMTIDEPLKTAIDNLEQLFLNVFESQSQVFVHLDYHSRNLMHVTNGNNPGIIDFQDAMFGPIVYDLVSLFQDAYISWPRAQVEAWVQQYAKMAIAAGLITTATAPQLLKQFDLVGLQRHIKNLGVFARLHHRDQKSNYLNDIPMLLNYIVATIDRYPELAALREFFQTQILKSNVTVAVDSE